MQAKTFFISFVSILIGVLLLLAGFNWLVDPGRLFSPPAIEGLNRHKPQWFYSQLLSKPYAVRRARPDALLMGTSRAGVSLNPDHPAWNDYRVYNLALAGTTAMVQWRSLQHAVAVQPVKKVLLGLDLFMFNACRDQEQEQPVQEFLERLKLPAGQFNTAYPRRTLVDHATALLSLETTRKSWRTWRAQVLYGNDDAGLLHAYANGHWYKTLPAATRQRSAFRTIERQYIRSDWFPAPHGCFALEHNRGKMQLAMLQQLMELAHREDIDLYLFFSPFHARLGEAMAAVGIWEKFEQLKHEVVALNEKLALEYGRAPFVLWDFSGYNAINTELVPAAGDTRSRMRWYLDGTHGSEAIGDLVQDRIFGLGERVSQEEESFGVRLSSVNLPDHLLQTRKQREDYRAKHPGDVREVRTTAQRAGRLVSD